MRSKFKIKIKIILKSKRILKKANRIKLMTMNMRKMSILKYYKHKMKNQNKMKKI